MVLGTTSGAGKSWLGTALCRWYARQGLKVAPFKAQNMSNNARVVDGGEIGSAQYFQALAARALPDVRMNPVLLKPERDTHSQVVLLGQVDTALTAMPWRGRSEHVWPHIARSLDALREGYEVYVVVDAVGGTSLAAHEAALRRIEQAGGQLISVPQLFCELQRDWQRQDTVPAFMKLFIETGGTAGIQFSYDRED